MITNKAQGNNISTNSQNPFPGLRSFGVDESHLFFGREGQSETILQYLAENRFAAITGASGSGKSSLIYCGLIPLLYGGFISNAGSKWRIIATRPGNKPVQNLADGLVESESAKIGNTLEKNRKNLVYALLRRSSYGLIDAVSQMGLTKNENLLLIFDQFEELFRFKENRQDSNTTINETEAYIKLIVNAVKQTEQPIYVVLTMRSDFIGDCSEFHSFTKLINESNFLIPQMTREDYKNAILGPLAVASTNIDTSLLHKINNTISEKSDQLPVLQHAMMRTWEIWKKHNDNDSPIRIRDYEAAGKIEHALSMHANIAYEELDENGKYICKRMFQTLTEKTTDNKGTRHPATIRQIAEVAQVSISEVIQVVEKFRSNGRSFLTPSEKTPLESNTVIDISHESLMRVWDRLRNWVEEESASVEMYRRLSDAAAMYQTGKTGLLRPPDLQLAISWRKTQKPNISWAKKFHPAFERVMVYLDASEKKFRQEEENKIKLQQRTITRTRRFAFYMGTVALTVIIMAYFLFVQYRENKELRLIAENRATIEERAKNDALEQKENEQQAKLRVLAEKDSVESHALMQILEKEQEASKVYVTLDEVKRQSDSLQKTANQVKQDMLLAEQTAKQAMEDRLQLQQENEKVLEQRMLALAQKMAVKSLQVNEPNLKSLLAYQAYKFNNEFKGQPNQPDIYTGLYSAIMNYKQKDYENLTGHKGEVADISFAPGRNVAYSVSEEGEIMRWDLYKGSQSVLIKNNGLINTCLAVSPDGQWLACGTSSSVIQLYNLRQRYAPPIELMAHEGQGGVYKIEFLPGKNQLISTGSDRTIKLWNLFNYTSTTIATSPSKINDITLNADNTKIFAGLANGQIVEWDIQSGNQEVLYSNADGIHVLSINKSGRVIAAGDRSGSVILIILGSKNRIMKINAHSGRVYAIDFNPKGNQLATSSMDGTIKIWNTTNFNYHPIIIREHESWVRALAFSPDGKKLISSSQKDNIMFQWPANADLIADQMCNFIVKNMTLLEWNTNVASDVEYEKTCE